jgi:hypothetical protein
MLSYYSSADYRFFTRPLSARLENIRRLSYQAGMKCLRQPHRLA